jgi:hypothetical protein
MRPAGVRWSIVTWRYACARIDLESASIVSAWWAAAGALMRSTAGSARDHPAPRLIVEFVSKSHPTKDYVEIPDQCAAIGVEELVLFDPTRSGPRAHGGGNLLQIWRRANDGGFERVFAGDSSAHSSVLDAWLIPSASERDLSIAGDRRAHLWRTSDEAAEAERAAKEAARSRCRARAELRGSQRLPRSASAVGASHCDGQLGLRPKA